MKNGILWEKFKDFYQLEVFFVIFEICTISEQNIILLEPTNHIYSVFKLNSQSEKYDMANEQN